jgi:hypothetical protein
MAQLKDIGKCGSGILQPLIENRFLVHYRAKNMSWEQLHLLTQQTVKFNIDLKNKHISFEIEQPITGDMIGDVQELVSNPAGITMHAMDGAFNSISRTQFTMLECVSHEFVMDYASGNKAARHKIVMKYLNITTKE